jgi:hypothetical protein
MRPLWLASSSRWVGYLSPAPRTEYGPRVCADKARARCRKDTRPTSLRKPQRLWSERDMT